MLCCDCKSSGGAPPSLLLRLPQEIFAIVAGYLPLCDVLVMRGTGRPLNNVLSIGTLWAVSDTIQLVARSTTLRDAVEAAQDAAGHLVWGDIWLRVVLPCPAAVSPETSPHEKKPGAHLLQPLEIECARMTDVEDGRLSVFLHQMNSLRLVRLRLWNSFLDTLSSLATASGTRMAKGYSCELSPFVCWSHYQLEEHWLQIFRFTDVELWCTVLSKLSFECHCQCLEFLRCAVSALIELFTADAKMRHVAVKHTEETRDVAAAFIAAITNAHTNILSLARLLKRLPEVGAMGMSMTQKYAVRSLVAALREWGIYERRVMHTNVVCGFSVVADTKQAADGYRSLLQLISRETRESLPVAALSLSTVTVYQLRSLCENEHFEKLLFGLIRAEQLTAFSDSVKGDGE